MTWTPDCFSPPEVLWAWEKISQILTSQGAHHCLTDVCSYRKIERKKQILPAGWWAKWATFFPVNRCDVEDILVYSTQAFLNTQDSLRWLIQYLDIWYSFYQTLLFPIDTHCKFKLHFNYVRVIENTCPWFWWLNYHVFIWGEWITWNTIKI